MKYLVFIFLLHFSLGCFSQKNSVENINPYFVEKRVGHFYKNSWKPFSGTVLLLEENPKLTTKIKIENGFEIVSELYDKNNQLVQVLKNGVETDFDSSKTEFAKDEIITDLTALQQHYVLVSYNKDLNTGHLEKINDVRTFENTKVYYSNGIKVKVEYYFDNSLKKLKESYEIFHTDIGNIEFSNEMSSYHGHFKILNENGKIIEEGIYELGKKTKK